MLNLSEFAVRQVFNRAKDDDDSLVYWTEVDEGYLIVWPESFDKDGTNIHHHTYRHPVDLIGFEPWPYDD